jgi:cellulose synthase/poly-beta-1,6-N-acetylglucosamine synthase-like glycosyltransferase
MRAATLDVPAAPQPSSGRVPPVAIVLVNWNSWQDSVECLDSLLAQAYPDFHVFLVDNDSSDGSLEHIREWCAAPRRQVGWRTHDGVTRVTDSTAAAPMPCRLLMDAR